MPASLPLPPDSLPPDSLLLSVGETHDGTGFGDHDLAFTWGVPRSYLTLMVQARLQIMRGECMDTRRGEVGGAADGDTDWVRVTELGVFIPDAKPPPPKPPRTRKTNS